MVLGVSAGLKKRFGPLSKRGSWAFRAGHGQFVTGTGQVAEVDEEEAEMEPDGLGMRESPRKRPEPGESSGRTLLVVAADGRCGEGLGVVRRGPRGRDELSFGRDWAQRLLERRPTE